MTCKTELLALADRVEALEGPDRNMDMLICVALDTGRSTDPRNPGAPRYTSSIDAAMTLVPEGYVMSMGNITSPGWFSSTHEWDGYNSSSGRAQMPALSLCAAALRAIAEGME